MALPEGATAPVDLAHVSVVVPSGWTALPDGLSYVPAERVADLDPLTPFFSAAAQAQHEWRTLDEVLASHASALLAEVDQPRLLEAEATEVDERPASRVVLARIIDGVDVTLEHWAVPLGGRSLVVLSAQAPTLAFLDRFNEFRDLLGGVTIDG